MDAKDAADKSSILDNLRYESSGYNSVVPHFLGLLKSEVFGRLTEEIKEFFLLQQAETEAVRADPSKRGAALRTLVKERDEAATLAAAAAAANVQHPGSIPKRTVSADALRVVATAAPAAAAEAVLEAGAKPSRKRTKIHQDQEGEEEEEEEEEVEQEKGEISRKAAGERGEKSKKQKKRKFEVQKTKKQKVPSTLDLFSPVSSSAEDTE